MIVNLMHPIFEERLATKMLQDAATWEKGSLVTPKKIQGREAKTYVTRPELMAFIASGEVTPTFVCQEFGVTLQTANKALRRAFEAGVLHRVRDCYRSEYRYTLRAPNSEKTYKTPTVRDLCFEVLTGEWQTTAEVAAEINRSTRTLARVLKTMHERGEIEQSKTRHKIRHWQKLAKWRRKC